MAKLKKQTSIDKVLENIQRNVGKRLSVEDKRRLELFANDMLAFGRDLLPHYFSKPGCGFHREIAESLISDVLEEDSTRTAVAAPRESAKSTIVSLLFPIWLAAHIKLTGKKFLLLVSDTQSQARRFLEFIKDELEGNDRLKNFYGEELIGPSDKWTQDRIVTQGGFTIQCFGTRQKIRGVRKAEHRPDVIVCDDLENDQNIQTPEQRNKNRRWFFNVLCRAAVKTADIFVIGTVLHRDSLLSELLHRNASFKSVLYRAVISWSPAEKLWEVWERFRTDMSVSIEERKAKARKYFNRNEHEMTRNTEVVWPEHRSYYDLMEIRISDGPSAFSQEMQNEPLDPDECLFNEEWFQWFIEDQVMDEIAFTVAAVDPSLGKSSRRNDPSAIVCLGITRKGALYVLDADIERRPPNQIIEDVIQLYLHRRCILIGVEENQFQEFFKDRMSEVARERGFYPPIRGIRSIKDKELRIQRLQPQIKNGTIRLQKRHRTLIDQLRFYPLTDHDDGPDALEMAVQTAEHIIKPRKIQFGKPRAIIDRLSKVFG